jgi:hypothetical protein
MEGPLAASASDREEAHASGMPFGRLHRIGSFLLTWRLGAATAGLHARFVSSFATRRTVKRVAEGSFKAKKRRLATLKMLG